MSLYEHLRRVYSTQTWKMSKNDLHQTDSGHHDLEKVDVEHAEVLASLTPAEQKRLNRRIDLRLVVPLGCLYCISLLDRTNLGAASVAG